MPLKELTFDTLQNELKGGLVGRMLAGAMNRVAQDLVNAPDNPDARKVTLEITAKPIMEDGELGDAAIEFSVGHKIPKRVTSARMVVKRNDQGVQQFFFAVDSPDNPDQKPLFGEQAS